jgi:hypothetical protein
VWPALIIEIASPETASIDRSSKLEEYDLAGVPLYIIVDTLFLRRQPTLRLLGYAQTPRGYQPLASNEQGWLWLEPARIWLGIRDDEIICFDEAHQPLGDYRALSIARAEAERRADAAEARVRELDAEIRRLRQVEAELQRLRGESS